MNDDVPRVLRIVPAQPSAALAEEKLRADMVSTLEEVLAAARAGELEGLAVVASKVNGEWVSWKITDRRLTLMGAMQCALLALYEAPVPIPPKSG